VSQVQCGQKEVGNEVLNKTAQGQFCLVTMSVKNIGDVPQTMLDANQKAFGPDGSQYEADSTAGIYANNQADVFVNNINPGNTVTGVVVFDIPTNAKIAKLQLHDSAFSGGATVTVP